jgi:hypothetical protein
MNATLIYNGIDVRDALSDHRCGELLDSIARNGELPPDIRKSELLSLLVDFVAIDGGKFVLTLVGQSALADV